jgi:dihydrodipicolinate synthase/N-acetylneuraminate lyase
VRKEKTMFRVPNGVMQSPLTPMTKDGSVDHDTLERLLDFHIRQGASGICYPLHIAESPNLTIAERKAAVETAKRAIAGRVPLLVNVSVSGTDQAIDLARHAESVGADGIIVLAPYYWPLNEDGLFGHFVGSSVKIAMMAYNSPNLQGASLTPELLARMIERLPNFVGLKEASHDWEYFIEAQRTTSELRPDFAMMVGVEYVLPSMMFGGKGSLSAFGGVTPGLIGKLYDACARESYREAYELQKRASQLWTLFKVDYPARIKSAMRIMGRPVGNTRLPIQPLDAEAERSLEKRLAELGVLESEQHGWNAVPEKSVARKAS